MLQNKLHVLFAPLNTVTQENCLVGINQTNTEDKLLLVRSGGRSGSPKP